ncbi:hypothetical protein PV325_005310 [Microctonus aethiopoides]|nr:hypothetical protein PV325_005310 [Microctonus aethiopoides]
MCCKNNSLNILYFIGKILDPNNSEIEIKQIFENYWNQYTDNPLIGRDRILSSICPRITHLKFWKLIREQMKDHEIDETREQCINKMENLKKSYKKTKDANSQSGNGVDTCAYYEILDEMFSTKPWIKPLSVAGNSVRLTDFGNDLSASPPCKKMKVALNQAKINYLEDAIKDRQLKREEKAIYNERKLQIFEKVAESLKK